MAKSKKETKKVIPTVGAGIPVKKKVTIAEKAELLRQDLSLTNLLDLFAELCKKLNV